MSWNRPTRTHRSWSSPKCMASRRMIPSTEIRWRTVVSFSAFSRTNAKAASRSIGGRLLQELSARRRDDCGMGLFQKMSEAPEQLRAQEIRKFCSAIAGVQQIAECRARTRPRIVGVVQSIMVDPRTNPSTLRIEIYDGTDEITGVWYGRREIPGIGLGRPLVLEGTVRTNANGTLEIMNPAYALVPAD